MHRQTPLWVRPILLIKRVWRDAGAPPHRRTGGRLPFYTLIAAFLLYFVSWGDDLGLLRKQTRKRTVPTLANKPARNSRCILRILRRCSCIISWWAHRWSCISFKICSIIAMVSATAIRFFTCILYCIIHTFVDKPRRQATCGHKKPHVATPGTGTA